MIFVTVGTQLPFDRLIQAVDGWAGDNPGAEVFAQIGPTELRPRHLESVAFLKPDQADRLFRTATLVISHAGMGSIITSLKYRKPLLIVPRMASLGEHRNDHQLATAKWLGSRSGISVAWSEEEVPALIDGLLHSSQAGEISDYADPQFIARLRNAIF
ncbi:MAG: glycosyl transferase family 28 [Desulfuromonadales bacterium]|nr:MAG: glycosyl transferase family 28 [Desulfuromonadales bacterium]